MGDASKGLSGHLLIAVPFPENAELIASLRRRFPELKVTYKHIAKDDPMARDHDIPDEIWEQATHLTTLSALPPVELAKNLKFIQLISAGSNHIHTHPLYTGTQIPVATASGIHGPAISEWFFMAALAAAHRLPYLQAWQRAGTWGPGGGGHAAAPASPLRTVRDLCGQRIGILGYGGIGRQIGRVARAMGMEVLAFTAGARPTPESRRDSGYHVPGTGDPEGEVPAAWFAGLDRASLHGFLGQDLDLLVVCVPLTDQTTDLLGRDEFRVLEKRNAFVANVSRGKIVQQDALVEALRAYEDDDGEQNRGKSKVPGVGRKGLRGAALDVADPEPLPDGHELFSAPNCFVSPHISGLTTVYAERALAVLDVNLESMRDGKPLVNLVDRKRGY